MTATAKATTLYLIQKCLLLRTSIKLKFGVVVAQTYLQLVPDVLTDQKYHFLKFCLTIGANVAY